MLTSRRIVLSTPRSKKLLWAAVKGNRNIVIVGGITPRRTVSVPSLRQLMRGQRQRILVEVIAAPPFGAHTRRWGP